MRGFLQSHSKQTSAKTSCEKKRKKGRKRKRERRERREIESDGRNRETRQCESCDGLGRADGQTNRKLTF